MLYYITCLRFDRELFAGLKCFITFPLDKVIFFLPLKKKRLVLLYLKKEVKEGIIYQISDPTRLNSTEQPLA